MQWQNISQIDLQAVLRLAQQMSVYQPNPTDQGLVITEKGKLIGFIVWMLVLDEATILSIAVEKDWQSRGLAKKLLDQMLSHVQKQGVDKVFLEVKSNNTAAINLYKSKGFQLYDSRKNYYQQEGFFYDALLMRKLLAPE